MLELLLSLKFIYDIVMRLIKDKIFRTLGLLVFILVLVGTLFFWLVGKHTFLHALAYSVGTLSLNSPYNLNELAPPSNLVIIFNIIYIFIGVGVYLIFVMEAGRTIIAAHHDFEKKMAERKASRKAAKAAKKAALGNK